MDLPEMLKELVWRVAYFRRNIESWTLLAESFKPSTTNEERDLRIKYNTLKVLMELKAFYESASSLTPMAMINAYTWNDTNPLNPSWSHVSNGDAGFSLMKPPYWPAKNMALSSTFEKKPNRPLYNPNLRISTGLKTPINDTLIRTGVSTTKEDALRIQASNPFNFASNSSTSLDGVPAAENINQDIEMVIESAKMIMNSYGAPYTTTRGEDCTRWLFNSRNTAMKAIALIVQECPWFIQTLNYFNFFNNAVTDTIASIKPTEDYTQIYGHFESADDSIADSPRHLLTPLWSTQSNTVSSKQINELSNKGIFQIQYYDSDGLIPENSAPQDLLLIYCNNTYEANSFATNKPA